MPKYRLRQVHQITMLYIFWFLHQTTTGRGEGAQKGCCISFDSYIKPQLASCCFGFLNVVYLLIPTSNHNHELRTHAPFHVVYLLIPTSNHNSWHRLVWRQHVVYLLNPTSNHNVYAKHLYMLALYIFWFLHQTTTQVEQLSHKEWLYIFWFLHQTTTLGIGSFGGSMLYIFWILHQTTTFCRNCHKSPLLYIFWILHQTTTYRPCGRGRK